MKTEWTKDHTETLRRLTTQMRRPDGRIDWKGLLASPEGRQLLKGRKTKEVQNQYTWRIARANPPAEPPPPVAAVSNGSWTAEEEAELARLVNKYTYGKGVGWKRMQVEEPEAIARLTAHRPMSALLAKYKQGPSVKRHKKKREVPPDREAVAPVERPLPHFCHNCGAPLTPVIKGLELYHKLKHH